MADKEWQLRHPGLNKLRLFPTPAPTPEEEQLPEEVMPTPPGIGINVDVNRAKQFESGNPASSDYLKSLSQESEDQAVERMRQAAKMEALRRMLNGGQ